MSSLVPRLSLLIVLSLLGCLLFVSLPGSAARLDVCPTTDPTADIPWSVTPDIPPTDAEIESIFTAGRAANGCAVPLVLPVGFDAMTPAQQELSLFNSEREVRGIGDLQLDSTLLGQIAYNHSLEMATYGYFAHSSPVNSPASDRFTVDPALSSFAVLENIQEGFPVSLAVYQYLYQDTGSAWGHRHAILNPNELWVGIGIVNDPNSQAGMYTTDDFINPQGAGYTPPVSADTGPPTLGAISYANGTATVSNVADSPQNVNTQGNPVTAGITSVVFYTNNVTAADSTLQTAFNTVQASQTPPGSGTWTASITVNPGDVLHAVATDGSGNFTDISMNPPAVPLTTGANSVALPAATGTNGLLQRAAAPTVAGLAVTRTAAGLAASIDKQLGRDAVEYVRVFVGGSWRTFTPGSASESFPLYTSEGVVVGMRTKGKWQPPAAAEPLAAPTVKLTRGWNFVAAPYPITHLTCHAVRLELARDGVRLEQITVGPSPTQGLMMRPNSAGKWPGDIGKVIDDQQGFWVEAASATTWVPNATQFGPRVARDS